MQIFLRKNILFLIIFLFCKLDFAKRGVFDQELNFPITSPIILLTPTKCYFLCLAGRCLLSFPERNRWRSRLLQSARYMTSMWGLHLFSAFSLSLASFCLFLYGFRCLVYNFRLQYCKGKTLALSPCKVKQRFTKEKSPTQQVVFFVKILQAALATLVKQYKFKN